MLDKESLEKKFKAQRGSAFSLVLNDDFQGLVLKNTRYVFNSIMTAELPLIFVACIKHECDVSDDGSLKTPHYHVVIVLSGSIRIGTLMNSILDTFNGLKENQVSIEKCNSVSMQTRYLIHLDDYDKYQYDTKDIQTNNNDQVNYYLKEIHKIVDVNDLIAIVREYRNLSELIRVIGLENYKKYRIIIKDLRECL